MQSEVHNMISNYKDLLCNICNNSAKEQEGSPQMDKESLRNPSGCAEFDLERRGKSDTLVEVLTVLSASPQVLEEIGERLGDMTMDLSLTS